MTQAKFRWPQIGDILQNHSGGRPDPTGELAGKKLSLALRDGARLDIEVADAAVLSWRDSRGGAEQQQQYQAFRVRDGQYFVDYVRADNECLTVSIWVDLARGAALVIEGAVTDREIDTASLIARVEKTGSQSTPTLTYLQASINGAAPVEFARTARLSGKYFRYVYSDTHIYDHFYISEKFYFWYCWSGPDAGLGDFDEADYFELGDELYLVGWREKFLPCLALMVEDHRENRTIGKVYGADSHSWRTGNSTVGATMSIITEIPIPVVPAAA